MKRFKKPYEKKWVLKRDLKDDIEFACLRSRSMELHIWGTQTGKPQSLLLSSLDSGAFSKALPEDLKQWSGS